MGKEKVGNRRANCPFAWEAATGLAEDSQREEGVEKAAKMHEQIVPFNSSYISSAISPGKPDLVQWNTSSVAFDATHTGAAWA